MVRLISQNSSWLLQASAEIRSDKEIVLMAVRRDPFILRCVGAELRDDYDVVLAAMRKHRDAFRYAGPSLRDQEEDLVRMCDAKVILSLHACASTEALTTVKATTMGGSEVVSVSLAPRDSASALVLALQSDLPPCSQAADFVLPSGRLLSDVLDTATVAEALGA
ncbi:unnamed protein product [Prorocentrum cordatum]|uniref:DUF4116 domain-containing protein n=1 Tax=Prorocentrum cordatum TaxID=2364126 RepID=A0ABN9UN77_9DINO|nr:unnamed protein product [Polarella glacialis]